MLAEQYLIICLSNQFYNSPFKTNKHLVMEEMVENEHNVIFVNPPTRLKGRKHAATEKLEAVEYLKNNLVIYSPSHTFNIYPLTKFASHKRNKTLLGIIKDKKWINNKRILWIYHFDYPRIWELVSYLCPDLLIYDVVDNYAGFPEYSRNDSPYTGFLRLIQTIDRLCKVYSEQKGKKGVVWVQFREKQLAQRANIVFASHPLLRDKFHEYNSNTIYTPNAGAFELFSAKPQKTPIELMNLKHPIVGYSGAIDSYKFDIDLFIYLAQNTPEINYVLIGAMQLSDSDPAVHDIRYLSNVHFLGTKSFEETATFTHFFDAYIIPYKVNDYTYFGCFPVKLFNAMATGIPIIVTDLPAYHGLEDVLYIAKDKSDFLKMVRESLIASSYELKQKRINIAKENTWKHKVKRQLIAIEDAFKIID